MAGPAGSGRKAVHWLFCLRAESWWSMPLVNCTPRIKDVRAVRAAAFLPYVTGLTLLIVAAPLAWLVDHDAREATAFLAASLALLLTAALMKRGVFLAALVLAAGLVVIL